MNLNTVYLQGHDAAFTPEEVASVLEHGVLNRHQLLQVVAARVAGFDYVAAGALLNGVEGHPQALARVVELFEQTQRETFALLADEVIASIGARGIRNAWKRMKQSNSVAARDVLMEVHTKIEAMAAKPFSDHKKDRAARAFSKLLEAKRPQGNAPMYPAFDNVSH